MSCVQNYLPYLLKLSMYHRTQNKVTVDSIVAEWIRVIKQIGSDTVPKGFNPNLNKRHWPHTRGGKGKSGEVGEHHDFVMACVLQNTFNISNIKIQELQISQ